MCVLSTRYRKSSASFGFNFDDELDAGVNIKVDVYPRMRLLVALRTHNRLSAGTGRLRDVHVELAVQVVLNEVVERQAVVLVDNETERRKAYTRGQL